MFRPSFAWPCCILLSLFPMIANSAAAAERPKPLKVLPTGDDNYVRAVAFSPDSRTLLATASMDTTVMLWSVTEFSELTSDR